MDVNFKKQRAPAISKRLKNAFKSPINMELERLRTNDCWGSLKVTQEQSIMGRDSFWISALPLDVYSANRELQKVFPVCPEVDKDWQS